MSGRLAIAAGLVTGVVAAGALLVALVALVPDPGAPSAPPTVPPAFASASSSASAGPPVAEASPSAGASGSAGPSDAGEAFGVGEAAPPLDVAQVGGGRIALAELRGQPVWVNFMATYCPPCIDEFPVMNGFAARYADEGLVVVAVDVREDEGTVAAFAERLNTSFPIGLDADGAAQEAWGAFALPVHYWVDAEGIVREGAFGGIGPDVMAEALGTILPDVEVTP